MYAWHESRHLTGTRTEAELLVELKMPGPRGVITVNGNTERSLHTEEHTAALATEAQSSLLRQTANSPIKPPDTFKRLQSNLEQDRLAHPELA